MRPLSSFGFNNYFKEEKFVMLRVTCASIFFALLLSIITAYAEPLISGVTFAQVNRLFAYDSELTDLQKEEEWKNYRGRCIEWTGEVAYLESGFFGGISIGMKHLNSTLTYDVLIDAPSSQKKELLSWRKGTRHTYRATLVNYGSALLPILADWGCEES